MRKRRNIYFSSIRQTITTAAITTAMATTESQLISHSVVVYTLVSDEKLFGPILKEKIPPHCIWSKIKCFYLTCKRESSCFFTRSDFVLNCFKK